MNLKTYHAATMAEALKKVKADLGPSAVILHTRTFRRGGFMGIGARTVVEITASDNVNVSPRPGPRGEAKAASNANLLRRVYRTDESPPASSAAPADKPPMERKSQNPSPPADDALNAEVKQIRRMVQRMMKQQAAAPRPALPETLFNQYLALLEQEVTEELAEDVIAAVREELTEAQLHDQAALRKAIGRHIAQLIPTNATSDAPLRTADGRPRTIALVGPTGVGKTTTLAKLAATFKLRDGRKVGLITIDTYRIAAVDQLKTYANIIGIPLHVVLTPQEMTQALEKCADCDLVLIDTAGRSQRDDGRLEELRAFLAAADPHEIHLVLSSTCSQPVLMEAVERFSALRVDHVIFTKLDEAVSFGVILNVVRQVNKRLSYLTTGQEVPHQIEPGRGDRLAALILGQGV